MQFYYPETWTTVSLHKNKGPELTLKSKRTTTNHPPTPLLLWSFFLNSQSCLDVWTLTPSQPVAVVDQYALKHDANVRSYHPPATTSTPGSNCSKITILSTVEVVVVTFLSYCPDIGVTTCLWGWLGISPVVVSRCWCRQHGWHGWWCHRWWWWGRGEKAIQNFDDDQQQRGLQTKYQYQQLYPTKYGH